MEEFESAFAAWQGSKFCVFVNSGSSANLLLISSVKMLFDWRSSDEVIVPAVTWPTTITPIMQLGFNPVFVDANIIDLSYDYGQLEQSITPQTRGIFVAHLLGFPANIQRLKDIIKGRNITILEDCCESQGALLNGVKVGNLGLGGTFSFYWGHHMTTVEGGMLCTNNEELYKIFLLKRSHGMARELPSELHPEVKARFPEIDFRFLFLTDGFNFRNTEFSAVLGLAQLKRIDEFIAIRNRNYDRFAAMCKRYTNELIVLETEGHSSMVLPFIFRKRELKQRFQEVITEAGIESRPLISGNLLRQPFLNQYYDPNRYRNADFLHTNAFYIGNNQFVDGERLGALENLLEKEFTKLKN